MRPLVLLRIEEGARAKPHQAAIPLLARRQQHQPRKVLADLRRPAAILLIAEVDRERAANDRLDAGAGQLFGELERAEHVVGVGQRQRRLPVLLGKLRQPRNGQRALKQRVGRMHVQMHEAGFVRCGHDLVLRCLGDSCAERGWRIACGAVHERGYGVHAHAQKKPGTEICSAPKYTAGGG